MRIRPALLCLVLLAGCAALPPGGPQSATPAGLPRLLPLDQLLSAAQAPAYGASAAQAEAVAARAALLRARAALMRGPVLAPETRARLESAIAAGLA